MWLGLLKSPLAWTVLAFGLLLGAYKVQSWRLDSAKESLAKVEKALEASEAKVAELEGHLESAAKAAKAQGEVIKAQGEALDQWAIRANEASQAAKRAADAAKARAIDAERTLKSFVDRYAAESRLPECEKLKAIDLEAVCALQ